jgi:O-antigen/teichoic acid export membrane protein
MVLGILIGFVGYPFLVRGLGTERFGVSSIAGAVVGYFMVFDLGLGRASVVVMGEALERRDLKRISGLFWSGQVLMFLLGTIGALVLAGTAPVLCRSVLSIPTGLVRESVWGLSLVAFSIPVMIVFSAHLGLLGNLGRFGALNWIRTLMNVLSWGAPLAALVVRRDLIATMGAMLVARMVTSLVSLAVCLRVEPALRRPRLASWSEIRPLLQQGGWMTVTNLASPLMSYMDRALVGAWSSLTAVAYYSVAGDTAQKLWIIQASVVGALFPTLPGLLAVDKDQALVTCRTAFRMLVLALVPIALVASSVGHGFLNHWIGRKIGSGAFVPFSILLLGVFINSFAHIPFSLIAASGKSRFAAILHLCELPLFLALLYFFVRPYGAIGASIAWTLRVSVDTGVLYWGGSRIIPGLRSAWSKDFRWIAGTAVVMFLGCFSIGDLVRTAMDFGWLAFWAWAYRADLKSRWESLAKRIRILTHPAT